MEQLSNGIKLKTPWSNGLLKYDQLSHHLECVLTALQKCKADSSDYDYNKLLTTHKYPIPGGLGINARLSIPAERDRGVLEFASLIATSERS